MNEWTMLRITGLRPNVVQYFLNFYQNYKVADLIYWDCQLLKMDPCWCPLETLGFQGKVINFFQLGECLKLSDVKSRIQSSPPIGNQKISLLIYKLVPPTSHKKLNLTMLSDGNTWHCPETPTNECGGPRQNGFGFAWVSLPLFY